MVDLTHYNRLLEGPQNMPQMTQPYFPRPRFSRCLIGSGNRPFLGAVGYYIAWSDIGCPRLGYNGLYGLSRHRLVRAGLGSQRLFAGGSAGVY